MTPHDFTEMLKDAAQQSAITTKIPASFVIADAALESGWGESQLTKLAMNLFGVKAGTAWTGDTVSMNTREFEDGAWVVVPASWRKYSCWSESLNDHAHFLQSNPRYAACFSETTGEGWAHAVAAAGYATDPNYAAKIIAIIKGNALNSLDVAAPVAEPVVQAHAPAVSAITTSEGPVPLSTAVELPLPGAGQPPMDAEQAADYRALQAEKNV